MALLELRDVEARYGPVRALHGVSLAVDEGADRGRARRERRRQDDDAARDLGHGQADAARSSFDGKPLGRRGPEAVAKLGVAHVPEGRGTFSELSVEREPPPRRLHAARLARRRHRADERLLPLDRRAARPARGHALRRRAADARARPRADEPAAAAAARRAVARARAARHARDLPDRARAEREGGPDRARRRAERRDRARGGRRTRTCSRSARSPCPGRATSSPATNPSARATWATDGRLLPAGRRGARVGGDLRVARARARADPPRDGRDQLRAGRDGDVHDLHRLDADREPRLVVLAGVRRRRSSSRSCSASASSGS